MSTHLTRPVDGFQLVYDRDGTGPPVVLLHGWPGDRHDYREVVSRLPGAEVVVPDLRGFGESDKHPADVAARYSAGGQARSVIGLIDELGLHRPVLVGYDVGSRVAQAVVEVRPDLVGALVLSPPLPGVGDGILNADVQPEYWYQQFHQSPLVEQVLDGRPDAVGSYLRYFWNHWSAPDYHPRPDQLDRLAKLYGHPGALVASINYYRAGAGAVRQALLESPPAREDRISTRTIIVWPGSDKLVPLNWSKRLGEYFAHMEFRLAERSGHFTPVEAPDVVVRAILDLLPPRPPHASKK